MTRSEAYEKAKGFLKQELRAFVEKHEEDFELMADEIAGALVLQWELVQEGKVEESEENLKHLKAQARAFAVQHVIRSQNLVEAQVAYVLRILANFGATFLMGVIVA